MSLITNNILKKKNIFISLFLAWLVHIFTASGIVTGFLALIATKNHDWKMAMFWLVIALIIDGIDGFFARLIKAEENLPFMKGKNIDHVVDFVNYAFIPAFMFYEMSFVDDTWNLPLTFLILLVSALYYGRANMVTHDNYFIGFPVLWNMVLFYYIFITKYESYHYIWITLLISILHFVPIKMAYPSQNSKNIIPTMIIFCIFVFTICAAIYYYPIKPFALQISAYVVLGYFSILCVHDTWISQKKS
ncbi:MAG: CDP-alcohol phosphatidyltransferase family protein [Saprospiraceae bacterium]